MGGGGPPMGGGGPAVGGGGPPILPPPPPKDAGKKPGTDVRIYSIGGTKDGVEKVKAGTYNGTTVLLPYEESYYASVALIMALEGKAVNAYVGEAEMPRVTGGPGTILINKENADKLQPNY